MALIYQPSKRIFCGWFEPLKSTTYSEYPTLLKEIESSVESAACGECLDLDGLVEKTVALKEVRESILIAIVEAGCPQQVGAGQKSPPQWI